MMRYEIHWRNSDVNFYAEHVRYQKWGTIVAVWLDNSCYNRALNPLELTSDEYT